MQLYAWLLIIRNRRKARALDLSARTLTSVGRTSHTRGCLSARNAREGRPYLLSCTIVTNR